MGRNAAGLQSSGAVQHIIVVVRSLMNVVGMDVVKGRLDVALFLDV